MENGKDCNYYNSEMWKEFIGKRTLHRRLLLIILLHRLITSHSALFSAKTVTETRYSTPDLQTKMSVHKSGIRKIFLASDFEFPDLVSFQIIHRDNLRLYAILFSKETVHIVIQFRRVYLETIWDIGRDCILLNP